MVPAVEGWNLLHWTTGEVPNFFPFFFLTRHVLFSQLTDIIWKAPSDGKDI